MAENKKSFVLYSDYEELFSELSNEDAGQLIKHILSYVNDKNPETENPIVKVSFIPIKRQLKRDLDKWEEEKVGKSNAGVIGNLKRWHKDIYDQLCDNKINLNEALEIAKHRTASHSDSLPSHPIAEIAVNVNVNDNVNDINNNLSVNWSKLLEQFNSITGKKIRVLSDKAKKQIKARLKEGYTKEDIVSAIVNCFNDSYHREHNYKWLTPEFISRADKMEKYANINPDLPPKQSAL